MARRTVGLDLAIRRLKALPAEQVSAVAASLKAGSEALAEEVARAAPYPELAEHTGSRPTPASGRSGLLNAIADEGLSFQVYTATSGKAGQGVFNPIWVEHGTKPHEIAAKNAKALHLKGSGDEAGFHEQVQHPGARAQPFFYPTIRAGKEAVRQSVVESSRAATARAMAKP